MYPGHGRMSEDPESDLQRAIKGAALLMSDTRSLFESIKSKGAFDQIKRATVEYSRRAADRRSTPRVLGGLEAMLHLDDADHPVGVVNISKAGMRLDRQLELNKDEKFMVSLKSIGDMECELVGHHAGHTRLKFSKNSPGFADLQIWLAAKAPSGGKKH